MKALIPIAALALGSCAIQDYATYEVTGMIIESDQQVECWTSSTFVRTDIKTTADSIYFLTATGLHNKMTVTDACSWDRVIDYSPGDLMLEEPGMLKFINADSTAVTTYMLYDLQNRYE